MTDFFRKIPKSLVVLALVLTVLTGYASASEGDALSPAPDVTEAPSDGSPDSAGGYDTIACSGADVTVSVGVEKHDTLSVASVAPDAPDRLVYPHADSEASALSEVIRSLFGSYTPRTQTVTTYYDGQPISTDEQIVPGLAGLDYEWIAGAVLFTLIIFCLFRLLGGVLKNG